MKTLKFTLFNTGALMLFLVFGIFSLQAQIQFAGYVSQGEGIAGWNADGSGPEPAGLGHQVPAPGFSNQYYYGSSHDYITGNPDHACAHFLPGSVGFPQFEQALVENGYTPEQVKIRYGLTNLGDDLEGIDWFFFEHYSYSNYYDVSFTFELDGQPFLAGSFDYANMYINTVYGDWQTESGYSPVYNVATNDTLMALANAFLADLDGREIKIHYTSTYGAVFSGNGRSGAFYNVLDGELTAGNPEFPFQGLIADHEGFAGWDADGTGPEPLGNGHNSQLYYGASLDYDDIDPDPDACLGHFLEGSTGFFNTLIQLEYRGYEIGDIKFKMGLESLGPDVYEEDWGFENGLHWCNYYNNGVVFELEGEPILMMLQDTNKLVSLSTKWISETGIGKLYDISGNASPEAQFVAQSFLRDVGTHYLKTIADNIQYVTLFSGNGRDGALYEIVEASLTGVHEQATFIPEGLVSGIWDLQGSPYFIDGQLAIENGQSLFIEPGVKVAVRGPYQFTVNGSFMAEGTADQPILFTRSNPNLWWDGIGYDGDYADTSVVSVFDHCIFEYACAQGTGHENSGGALNVQHHNKIEIYNSVFRHNKACIPGDYPPSGGAIGLWNADPLIQKCEFYDNTAEEYGGAIMAYATSEPVISNSLFYDNEAFWGGAIAFYDYSNGIVINNTFANDTAARGGALFFNNESNPQIINNIMWGNVANYGSQVYFFHVGLSHPVFYYNNIEGGKEGFYLGDWVDYLFNIDEDPMFMVDNETMPYMIEDMSPCKDMGTPDSSVWYMPGYLPETCLAGNPRIYNARIDIGACEYDPANGISNPIISVRDMFIYPNPARDYVYVQYTLDEPSEVSLKLFNTSGALLYKHDAGLTEKGRYLEHFSISDYPAGVYFLRMRIGNEIQTNKLIKMN